MCAGPAKLAGLTGKKGAIAAGNDADLIVFADDETQTVVPEGIAHKHRVTPYAGETLRGVVHATYLRGHNIAEGGRVIANEIGELV
jgi:allantoinase